jgi:hypothetical protein
VEITLLANPFNGVGLLMQEHPHLIKRASAWSKEKTAGERQHSNFEMF